MASPKALIELIGDSITRGYGLADISTQSVKAAYDYYLQGLVDVGLHGYDGFQSSALGPKFTSDVLPELDATRRANILVVLGGANDILGSTGDAATIAGRLQTVLNNAKAEALTAGITLKTGITELFSCSAGLGTWDEGLKNAVNTLIAAGSFTADFKGNSQDDAILGSQTEMAKFPGNSNDPHTVDGLHPNQSSNFRRALYVDLPVIGQLDNLPLIAVFDFPKGQYTSSETITPKNVPFGGNHADTKTWEWKVVGGSVLSTAQNPTLGPLAPGDYDIQLKVSTLTDGNQTVVRSIRVIEPNNVGAGAIDPAFPTPAPLAVVPMVVSGVTSPKIFIQSGGGSISGISGNNFNFNAPSSGDTIIKAEEEMWVAQDGTKSHSDAQNNAVWVNVDGYGMSSVARFTTIGDGFEVLLTSGFLGTVGNKFGIINGGSGNSFNIIRVTSTTVHVNTTGGGNETTLTVAAGDLLAVEIGPSSKILIKKNGTLVYTTTSSYDSPTSFPMLMSFIMLALITMPRPKIYGSGIDLWNSGESNSSVAFVPPSVVISNPLPGSTVKGTISVQAAAFNADGITNVQFKKDGSNLGSADTSAPYSVSLDTTGIADGEHVLKAVMTSDLDDVLTSDEVTVIVDNTAPTGAITNPVDNDFVVGDVELTASANDAIGVAAVQFQIDDEDFGEPVTEAPYAKTCDSTELTDGNHTVKAIISDRAGNTFTTPEKTFEVGNNQTGVFISGFVIGYYEGNDETLKLRIYANETFVSLNGITILHGQKDSKNFYKEVACRVNNHLVSSVNYKIEPVEGALSDPQNTSYLFALYTESGRFVNDVFDGIKIPNVETATIADIMNYNKGVSF